MSRSSPTVCGGVLRRTAVGTGLKRSGLSRQIGSSAAQHWPRVRRSVTPSRRPQLSVSLAKTTAVVGSVGLDRGIVAPFRLERAFSGTFGRGVAPRKAADVYGRSAAPERAKSAATTGTGQFRGTY